MVIHHFCLQANAAGDSAHFILKGLLDNNRKKISLSKAT